jgi:TRAP-type C4-dicarboxylate transport system substrate-binding protein
MKTGKKVFIVLFCFMLVVALSGCSSTPSQPATSDGEKSKEVTLKVFGAWPEGTNNLRTVPDLIDKVAEKSDGTVKIVWGGGPEAIPANQLAEALKNGVVDIAYTTPSFMSSHVKLAEAQKLIKPLEIRKNGGFEFIDSVYLRDLNTHYLGAISSSQTYSLYSNKKIEKLDDFKGLTFRATPVYQALLEKLGAGVVNISIPETYQALERNVVQGFGYPSVGIMDFGWHEVTKYVIEPGFFNVDTGVYMSDAAWQKLDEKQRAAIKEAAAEIEVECDEFYKKHLAEEKEKLTAAGMEYATLTEDVAEEFLKIANDAAWESALKVAPEDAAKLREFAEK